MQVARRAYIYLITFISLQMLLAGASSLLRLLVETVLGISQDVLNRTGYLREQFSLSASIVLVGALVWVVHWLLAQRSVSPSNPDADLERGSVLRKLLIYGVLIVALWQIFFALGNLLRDIALSALSTPGTGLGETAADSLPKLLVYGVAWLYYWRVNNHDARLTPETGSAATVRRWYFYLVCYATLSALMFVTSDLGRQLWRSLTGAGTGFALGGSGAAGAVASDAAWMVVSLAAWLPHWLVVQRLTLVSEDEQHSVLRKIYLYLMVLQTLAVTVTSLAIFLNSILRLLLGTNPLGDSGDSLLTQSGGPLVTALVYGLFWAYHWRVLKWDASLVASEPPRQASIRRAYHYLAALVGLAVLAGGVATLLRLLIDLVLGDTIATTAGRQAMGDQISLAATLIVVGGPVWYVNWLRVQRRALAPDGADDRHALLRRVYLYLILFLSVITLLISAGTLVYQILLTLGGGFTSDLINTLAGALGATITAGVLLAYHVRVMLADQRALASVAPAVAIQEAGGAVTVLLVSAADASGLDAALEEFRRRLPPGTQLSAFATRNLTPSELGAWLAARAQQATPPRYVPGPPAEAHQTPVQQTEPPLPPAT